MTSASARTGTARARATAAAASHELAARLTSLSEESGRAEQRRHRCDGDLPVPVESGLEQEGHERRCGGWTDRAGTGLRDRGQRHREGGEQERETQRPELGEGFEVEVVRVAGRRPDRAFADEASLEAAGSVPSSGSSATMVVATCHHSPRPFPARLTRSSLRLAAIAPSGSATTAVTSATAATRRPDARVRRGNGWRPARPGSPRRLRRCRERRAQREARAIVLPAPSSAPWSSARKSRQKEHRKGGRRRQWHRDSQQARRPGSISACTMRPATSAPIAPRLTVK